MPSLDRLKLAAKIATFVASLLACSGRASARTVIAHGVSEASNVQWLASSGVCVRYTLFSPLHQGDLSPAAAAALYGPQARNPPASLLGRGCHASSEREAQYVFDFARQYVFELQGNVVVPRSPPPSLAARIREGGEYAFGLYATLLAFGALDEAGYPHCDQGCGPIHALFLDLLVPGLRAAYRLLATGSSGPVFASEQVAAVFRLLSTGEEQPVPLLPDSTLGTFCAGAAGKLMFRRERSVAQWVFQCTLQPMLRSQAPPTLLEIPIQPDITFARFSRSCTNLQESERLRKLGTKGRDLYVVSLGPLDDVAVTFDANGACSARDLSYTVETLTEGSQVPFAAHLDPSVTRLPAGKINGVFSVRRRDTYTRNRGTATFRLAAITWDVLLGGADLRAGYSAESFRWRSSVPPSLAQCTPLDPAPADLSYTCTVHAGAQAPDALLGEARGEPMLRLEVPFAIEAQLGR